MSIEPIALWTSMMAAAIVLAWVAIQALKAVGRWLFVKRA